MTSPRRAPHRRRSARRARRPDGALVVRAAGDPAPQAGAGDREPPRLSRLRRPGAGRFQADRPPCRSAGCRGLPDRDAAAGLDVRSAPAPRRAARRAAGTHVARHRGGRGRVRNVRRPGQAVRPLPRPMARDPGAGAGFAARLLAVQGQRQAAPAAAPRARRHSRRSDGAPADDVGRGEGPDAVCGDRHRPRHDAVHGGRHDRGGARHGHPRCHPLRRAARRTHVLQHPRAPRPHHDSRLHRRRVRGHRLPPRDRSRMARRGGRRDPAAVRDRRARRSAALRALPRRRVARAPSPRRPAPRPERNPCISISSAFAARSWAASPRSRNARAIR